MASLSSSNITSPLKTPKGQRPKAINDSNQENDNGKDRDNMKEQISHVITVMQVNVERLAERGESLSAIQQRARSS